MKTRVFKISITVLLLLVLLFPIGVPVYATEPYVFNVNTFNDVTDFAEGNGVCSIGTITGGLCSLRAALQEADELAEFGDVVINLPPGVYTLSIPISTSLPDKRSGDLDIFGLTAPAPYNVLIRGIGQQASVINGNGIDRVLEVGPYYKVTLQNLVITGGRLAATDTEHFGGGILTRHAAETNLYRVFVENNEIICPVDKPACSTGGGIGVENSHLFISHSQVSANTAYAGAAIYVWDGNSVPAFTTTILNSTISGHTGQPRSIIESGTNLRVINSTMTDNTGNEGSSNIISLGPLWVQNSTLVYQPYGSNVNIPSNATGTHSIRNSILINYTNEYEYAAGNCIVNYSSPIVSEGGSVFTDSSCNPNTSTLWDAVITHGVLTDPSQVLLGPLQNNGGKVMTMKPMDGSQAIDRRPEACFINVPGEPAYPLSYDARDYPRTDGKCDAGAVEDVTFFINLPVIYR